MILHGNLQNVEFWSNNDFDLSGKLKIFVEYRQKPINFDFVVDLFTKIALKVTFFTKFKFQGQFIYQILLLRLIYSQNWGFQVYLFPNFKF